MAINCKIINNNNILKGEKKMTTMELTKKEACELWINRDFNSIPIEWMYKLDEEVYSLEWLFEYEENEYIEPIWGTIFQPKYPSDSKWIEDNAQEIYDKCGVLVGRTDEVGVFLSIDGCGYSFYEEHWLPLYDLRGFNWHCKNE